MRARACLALLPILAVIAGCKGKARPDETTRPAREDTVKVGDLQVTTVLEGPDGPFALEEDVFLAITLSNPTANDLPIPRLPGHASTWTLKDRTTDSARTVGYRPMAQPGVPMGLDSDDPILPAGRNQVYRLRLQEYLGPLKSGRYTLQYRFDSDPSPWTLPWVDFEIARGAITGFALVPSNPGKAEEIYLAWKDEAGSPARIFLRQTPIGGNRNLPPTTLSVATANAPSTPVASTFPSGPTSKPWVAWMQNGKLKVARPEMPGPYAIGSWDLPRSGSWTLTTPLVASGTSDSPKLVGTLTMVEGNKVSALVFEADGPTLQWHEAPARNAKPLSAFRLLPLPKDRHALVWLEGEKGFNRAVFLLWSRAGGFEAPVTACEFQASEAEIAAFAATSTQELLACAVAMRGARGGMAISNWKLDPRTLKLKSPKASTWNFAPDSAFSLLDLALDANGDAWALSMGRNGAQVQTGEWEKPTEVNQGEGAERAQLFFKRGDLPKVLLAYKNSPFEIRPVRYPDGGDTSDDLVEDNQ